MIFTIGDRDNYLKNMSDNSEMKKLGKQEPSERFPDGYEGGYCFQTMEDAHKKILEEDKVGIWDVFGLDCDWANTYNSGNWWNNLIQSTKIIILEKK